MKKRKNNKGITLCDFAKKIKVALKVEKISKNYKESFICSFKHSEIKGEGDSKSFLIGVCGSGFSRYAAMRDYATKIQGKILVIDAGSPKRKEFVVPKLKVD